MSLTQWMFSTGACNCDTPQQTDSSGSTRELTSVLDLCPQCGRPILTGRPGSMTQWIFRASSCDCHAKQLRLNPSNTSLRAEGPTPEPSPSPLPTAAPAEETLIEDDSLTADLGLPADRYRAIKLVGKGAVSRVYQCRDRVLNRIVAIKFLQSSRWTGDEILRFQSEAKATSRLTHPNIIHVHDFGATDAGQPYMVLEYFTGVSLEDLIANRGPLPEQSAAELGIQVARAMAFAHSKGVLHRDIKPENIMLIETDEQTVIAKVIDFGLADFVNERPVEIKGSSLVGTPAYMSPSQLLGNSADERSEIYALGCTLFEAMTGRPPFVGESTLDVINMHVSTPPPRLREALANVDFSVEMEKVIARSLQKDPEKTFADMSEFERALTAVLNPSPAIEEEEEEAHDGNSESTANEPNTATTSGARHKSKPLVFSASLIGLILILSALIMVPKLTEPKTTAKQRQTPLPATDELRWQSPFGPDVNENMRGNEALKVYQHKKKVDSIDIRAANITDDGLKYIMHCKPRNVNLEASKITDKGFRKICSIKSLRLINLSHCPQLRDYSCLTLRPELESAYFLSNEMTDDDLKWFAPLTKLRSINISNNPLINGTGLVHLQKNPSLSDLRLAGCQFTADGIKALSGLKQLQSLTLRFSNIKDEDLDAVSTMSNLNWLSLIGTDISDRGLLKLANLKHLDHLYIGLCQRITPQGIATLKKKLKKLDVNTDGAYSL